MIEVVNAKRLGIFLRTFRDNCEDVSVLHIETNAAAVILTSERAFLILRSEKGITVFETEIFYFIGKLWLASEKLDHLDVTDRGTVQVIKDLFDSRPTFLPISDDLPKYILKNFQN